MARLFEYQSKRILKDIGIKVPLGDVADTPKRAIEIAEKIGYPVVLKVQVWEKERKKKGGIEFAENPDELKNKAENLLGKEWGEFKIKEILVEKKIKIIQEMFAGIIIDDKKKKPLLVFSPVGGTGIEEIAKKHPEKIVKYYIDPLEGFYSFQAREILRKTGIKGKTLLRLANTLALMYRAMRSYDARFLEINPLVLSEEEEVIALDAHIVIDDYAVYRHPELGIEIAREFSRPPTELEKIAYEVEKNDYRGTFYFFQMVTKVPPDKKHIGFHGAGGGGSMMSADAVLSAGFKIANFTDTSGNPPSSKVYRAAKIILSQPNIVGYFASGSGLASQEQFHSARGFVKAFLEEDIDIPAVLRLGGNYEEVAIEILSKYLKNYKVEGYGKDDSPQFCAERLKKLVKENGYKMHKVKPHKDFMPKGDEYRIETLTGTVYIDHKVCALCDKKPCVPACNYNVLKIEDGKPVLAISAEDAKKGKCVECLACEIACRFEGKNALYIHLPVPGLSEYREKIIREA